MTPLLETITLDREAVAQYVHKIVSEITISLGEMAGPLSALERLLDESLNEFARDLPRHPGQVCLKLHDETGVPQDVVTLVLWSVFGPFYRWAAQSLLRDGDADSWNAGFCPVCGARPHMAVLRKEDGARVLECWLCGARWRFPRLVCPFCGNSSQKSLGFFHLGEDRARRVHFCDQCRSYLKVVDERVLGKEVVLQVENLAMLGYDAAARTEGYQPGSGLEWVLL
jgi:FdhE protein